MNENNYFKGNTNQETIQIISAITYKFSFCGPYSWGRKEMKDLVVTLEALAFSLKYEQID